MMFSDRLLDAAATVKTHLARSHGVRRLSEVRRRPNTLGQNSISVTGLMRSFLIAGAYVTVGGSSDIRLVTRSRSVVPGLRRAAKK